MDHVPILRSTDPLGSHLPSFGVSNALLHHFPLPSLLGSTHHLSTLEVTIQIGVKRQPREPSPLRGHLPSSWGADPLGGHTPEVEAALSEALAAIRSSSDLRQAAAKLLEAADDMLKTVMNAVNHGINRKIAETNDLKVIAPRLCRCNGVGHINYARRARLLLGLVTTFGVHTRPVFSRPLSLAIPLWVGAVSTGDGIGHCLRRNGEFCVAVGPVTRIADILAYCMLA